MGERDCGGSLEFTDFAPPEAAKIDGVSGESGGNPEDDLVQAGESLERSRKRRPEPVHDGPPTRAEKTSGIDVVTLCGLFGAALRQSWKQRSRKQSLLQIDPRGFEGEDLKLS
jgi:hypothetical protein